MTVQWSGTVGPQKGHSPIRRRSGLFRDPKQGWKVRAFSVQNLSAFQFHFNFDRISGFGDCDLVGLERMWSGFAIGFDLFVFAKMQSPCGSWGSDPGNRTLNDPTRPIVVTT